MVDKTDTIHVRRLNFEVARAISYIYDVFPLENHVSSNVVKSMRTITTNTKQRFHDKLEFSKALDGTSMIMPRDDYCN